MLIIGILCFGIMIGAIARFLVPGGNEMSWGRTLVIGLLGSFVGGLLASLLAGDGLSLRPSGFIGSIIGAMILVAGDRWYAHRQSA